MSKVHFLRHCAECGEIGAEDDGICISCRPSYPRTSAPADRFSDDVDPADPDRQP